jgi:hypothetical protein
MTCMISTTHRSSTDCKRRAILCQPSIQSCRARRVSQAKQQEQRTRQQAHYTCAKRRHSGRRQILKPTARFTARSDSFADTNKRPPPHANETATNSHQRRIDAKNDGARARKPRIKAVRRVVTLRASRLRNGHNHPDPYRHLKSPPAQADNERQHVLPTPLLSLHLLRRLPPVSLLPLKRELLNPATKQTRHTALSLGTANISSHTPVDIVIGCGGCFSSNVPAITIRGRHESVATTLPATSSPPPPSP